MKCIIFLFILIIAGCAGKPHIRPLDGYSDLETKPIIFGSIYGIPDGYDMVLYLRYRGLKGQVDSASAYFPNDRNKTDPIKHFQFCLPIGTWTVEKMEIVKVDHSYNLVKDKLLVFSSTLLDTMNVSFKTEFKSLHYIGSWKVTGFESIVAIERSEISNYLRQEKKRQPLLSEHSIPFTLLINNSEENDFNYFMDRYFKFRWWKKNSIIPSTDQPREMSRFQMKVVEEFEATRHTDMNWVHREFMKPNIPSFK